MTVLGFLKSLQPIEDNPCGRVHIKVLRDHIQIAVEIRGHVRQDDFPQDCVMFIRKKKPDMIGPFHFRGKEMTVYVFDDDGSLDDERGFPINWREI